MYQALTCEYLSDPALSVLCQTVGNDAQVCSTAPGAHTVRREMGHRPTQNHFLRWKGGGVLITTETEKQYQNLSLTLGS